MRHCCTRLLQDNHGIVVGMVTVTGYSGMLLDNEHRVDGMKEDADRIVDPNGYADMSLKHVVRVQVRTRADVETVIRAIDDAACQHLEEKGASEDYRSAVKYYESNMEPVTAATRRLGLDACRWAVLDTSLLTLTAGGTHFVGREFSVHDSGSIDICTLFRKPDPVEPTLPPNVRILSFDIECLSSDVDTMPDATRDGIIQISSVISADALGRDTEGDAQRLDRHLFTTGGACSPIPGVRIHEFAGEAELLSAFVDHVQAEDPDIVTGYNIGTFDLPYLFKRMEVHGVDASLGRGKRRATCRKRDCELVRQYASCVPKTHFTHLPGRVVFDMYAHVRREVVLRSYTLNNVSAHFLGSKKDDVGYREIPALFKGDADTRARLGRYCVKDAQLVLELVFKTQTFVHAFERCKVFRTMLWYTVDRGQQVKFYSMLLAWCSEQRILVDDMTSRRDAEERRAEVRKRKRSPERDGGSDASSSRSDDSEESDSAEERRAPSRDDCQPPTNGARRAKTKRAGYDGATVLEPVTGIYYTPVVCLDYASLYPSIMIGYNLCFTTFVRDRGHGKELADRGYADESPVGFYFLKRTVKKGVLPSILEMLLQERAEVRRTMAGLRESSIEYRLLDGQQGALKIAANSVYGAIGCSVNMLHLVEIPSSVTAYGRYLISRTKDHVEACYEGARVIYGDTDSVMVNLYGWDSTARHLWECAAIGKEMAATVTRLIDRHPIRLQFETVYRPFLLCTKKRYAAGVYGDLERLATMDVDSASAACRPTIKYKGLQVVRRDNCTFSTRLMRFVLESLMDDRNGLLTPVETIAAGLRDELTRLFEGRVNAKELVITKEWKKKGASGQAHDRLAQRMQRRDPNSAPSIGDRVPYVVVTTPRGAKLCDRAEHPVYAMEKGLTIDLLYYADNQVAKPIADLLRVVLQHRGSAEEIKDTFWPIDGPRRESDRRKRLGEKAWMRKASAGSRRLTDYFASTTRGCGGDPSTTGGRDHLVDVEDVLDGLAAKCLACKDGAVEAVRSCRDHECETLYERFANLKLRRRLLAEEARHRKADGDERDGRHGQDGETRGLMLFIEK